MNPNLKYYYLTDAMVFISETELKFYENEPFIEVQHGLKLSDGRIVVDDRSKTTTQLILEGKYDIRKNVLFSNIFHNPLLYLP